MIKTQVTHDGVTYDAETANLYRGDNSTNMQDAIRHGTHSRVKRTHCPRNHMLSSPNLRKGLKKRACRACANASEWARRRKIKGILVTETEFDEYADYRFREIMCPN